MNKTLQKQEEQYPDHDQADFFLSDEGLLIRIDYFQYLQNPYTIESDKDKQIATLYDGSKFEVIKDNENYYFFSEEENRYLELETLILQAKEQLPLINIQVKDFQYACTFSTIIDSKTFEAKTGSLINLYEFFLSFKQEMQKLTKEGCLFAITSRNQDQIVIQFQDEITFKNKVKNIVFDIEMIKRSITLKEQLILANKYYFSRIIQLEKQIQQLQLQKNTSQIVDCTSFQKQENFYLTKVYSEEVVRMKFQLNENEVDFQIGIVSGGDLNLLKSKKAMFFEIPSGNYLTGDPELGATKIINHPFNLKDQIWIDVDLKKHYFTIYINECKMSSITILHIITDYAFYFNCAQDIENIIGNGE